MSSSAGPQFGYGITRLLDAHQKFFRAGHPVYLRLRNFPLVQNQTWAQLGFSIAPSGSPVGTTDVLIAPQPSVMMMSIHNIGMSNGKLRFGARRFLISNTFVQAQVTVQGLADPKLVFEGSPVVGLVTENLLGTIEDIRHQELTGQTVAWILTCNMNTIK